MRLPFADNSDPDSLALKMRRTRLVSFSETKWRERLLIRGVFLVP